MDVYIDIGSTNIKWKDTKDGKVRTTPFPAPIKSGEGRFEVPAEEILERVRSLVCGAARAFVSVQMHGYVLMKRGQAVTDYVSWRDERGKDLSPAFALTKEYGVDIKPNLPRLSLQAQTTEFDEFCTLGSYLAYRLTGNNSTHITDAAPSGFYNVCKREKDAVPFRLPNERYKVERIGRYGATEIYTPVGDQQAAILGAVGKDFDGYVLNLGTAGQLCCIAKGFETGEFESRPYFGGGTLCTVTRLAGGGEIKDYADGEIEDRLVEEYGLAIKRLPKRDKILATGGVVKYRRELLCKVLERLGVEYAFNEDCDALAGLEKIAKGEEE